MKLLLCRIALDEIERFVSISVFPVSVHADMIRLK